MLPPCGCCRSVRGATLTLARGNFHGFVGRSEEAARDGGAARGSSHAGPDNHFEPLPRDCVGWQCGLLLFTPTASAGSAGYFSTPVVLVRNAEVLATSWRSELLIAGPQAGVSREQGGGPDHGLFWGGWVVREGRARPGTGTATATAGWLEAGGFTLRWLRDWGWSGGRPRLIGSGAFDPLRRDQYQLDFLAQPGEVAV